jgi:cyclophilin family peptidyl-prolyl cis-trans isomerase
MRILALAFLVAAALGSVAAAQDQPAPDAATAPAVAPTPVYPPGPSVLIETSLGNITLQLDPTHSPVTVQNFLRYVNEHHYDGTVIYRVVPGFVIQAGSYDANVTYRKAHEPIVLEANNGLSNQRGTIAMARENDPNTADAEFFINLADNSRLDHQPSDTGNTTGYAVFGHVADGMDVVDKIAAVPLGDHGPMPGAAPVDPITITRVSVVGQ